MIFLRKAYLTFLGEIWPVPWRMIFLAFLLILGVIPAFVSGEPYYLRVFTFALIYALFAASWDFLYGYCGQLSLGHALFFGVSAYTAALLNLHFHFSPWATIPLGAMMAVVAGLLTCLPALRLRGYYFALVTMSLPIIVIGLIRAFPDFTGGDIGLIGVQRLTGSRMVDYYVIFVVLIISLFVMWKMTDTKSQFIRTGLIFMAIRDDEISARASGINTTLYKALGFAISAFFAGVAGGLYVHYLQVTAPAALDLMFSFNGMIWAVVGGTGTLYGAVVGTYLLYPATEFLRINELTDQWRFVINSGILLVVILFMPTGLVPWVRDKIEVYCPRCKRVNARTRKKCRACRAELHAGSISTPKTET